MWYFTVGTLGKGNSIFRLEHCAVCMPVNLHIMLVVGTKTSVRHQYYLWIKFMLNNAQRARLLTNDYG